jgi:hypothetical protein
MSDLDLSLSMPKTKYAIGEEVVVLATVRNHTSQMIPFPNFREYPAPEPVYQVRGPDGKVVTYDGIPPEHRATAELPGYPHWLFPLQPGEATTNKFLVRRASPLNQPGEYTVSAHFKWRGIDLVAAPVRFEMASIRLSDVVLADSLPEPGAPAVPDSSDPLSWGIAGHALIFRVVEASDGGRIGKSWIEWNAPSYEPAGRSDYLCTEWPVSIGGADTIGASEGKGSGHVYVHPKAAPVDGKLIPTQNVASREEGFSYSFTDPFLWTPQLLQYGWPTSKELDSFEWFKTPSPKPIAQAIRVLYTGRPRTEKSKVDVFVVFAGEAAELGHLHIEGVFEKPTVSSLRPIASLGPGWVAAQAIIGPAALGEPKLIASIARHASGTQVTFLRVDGTGAILAKAVRVVEHVIPLGPVAMQVRVTGAEVEAAFPVKDARSGALHVVRVKAPVGLAQIGEPVVSPPIEVPEPTPTMLIAFSWFGAPFPQGVGLLMRQPGDKAFFWTEQRGLKPLPFTLRDQDEALILGKRSAWYVVVNNGIQIRAEMVESFFGQYGPRPDPVKVE